MKNKIMVIFALLVQVSFGQQVISDLTFDASGNNFIYGSTIEKLLIQADDKILIGLSSTNGSQPIVRLNTNGTIDNSFISAAQGGDCYDMVVQTDGKIILGGGIGSPQNTLWTIVRFNSDGTVDPSFNIGSGFDGAVFTLSLQTDGKIIVGGQFSNFNGFPVNRIVRLNTNGTLDNTFYSSLFVNNSPGWLDSYVYVHTTCLQSDGKVIVNGMTNDVIGNQINTLVRLNIDGSVDPTFDVGSGFDGVIQEIKQQTDGKIIFGGGFTNYNGTSVNHLTRLNPDGSIDPTFNIGAGFDGSVNSIALQSNGKMNIGGSFLTIDNFSSSRFVRLNQDGSIDLSFNIGQGYYGGNEGVKSIALQADGKVISSGDFTAFNNVFGNNNYRINRLMVCDAASTSYNSISANICIGDTYTWNDQDYTTPGQYQQTFVNQFGCDSIVTLNLTNMGPTYADQYVTVCPIAHVESGAPSDWYFSTEYQWPLNNQVYSLAGNYSTTIQNYLGCDSIVTLHLSFYQAPAISTEYATACGPLYYWEAGGGGIGASSPGFPYVNILQSTNGCDSIVSLYLNLLPESFSSFDISICPGNSYTWNNQQYTSAGQYQQTFVSLNGCDSVVTLNLTVLPNNFNPIFSSSQQLFTAPPFAMQFTNSTVNMANYSFEWNWGDGTSSISNSSSIFHEYLFNGLYTVSLVATNNITGCSDTTTITDYIFCTGGPSCTHTATINQQGPLQACAGTDLWLSCNNDPSFSYQWRRDGVNIPGNNNDSLLITQTGNYTVSIYVNNCPVTSNGVAVTITPLPAIPVITTSGNITSCLGGILTLNAPVGFSSYSWNTGATSANIDVTQSGSYFVTVENSGNCSSTSLPYVVNASFMSSPNVCVVGMDSLTNENRIVWEKPLTLGIDSFYVYKETNVSDVYTKIGATNYPDLAVFLDQNSNPAVQAYRYKLTVLDTCGTETLLSDFHKTIHLTINAGVGGAWNLIWSHYEGLTFGSYNIYRGTDPTNISLLTTIQSNLNSYTDLTPPVGPVYYQIEIVNPNSCDPTKVVNYSVSKSNIVNNGVNEINTLTNSTVMVYPNPTMDDLTITSTDALYDEYIIFDPQGRKVLSGTLTGTTTQLDLSRLARGNYMLQIGENKTPIKLIKQ